MRGQQHQWSKCTWPLLHLLGQLKDVGATGCPSCFYHTEIVEADVAVIESIQRIPKATAPKLTHYMIIVSKRTQKSLAKDGRVYTWEQLRAFYVPRFAAFDPSSPTPVAISETMLYHQGANLHQEANRGQSYSDRHPLLPHDRYARPTGRLCGRSVGWKGRGRQQSRCWGAQRKVISTDLLLVSSCFYSCPQACKRQDSPTLRAERHSRLSPLTRRLTLYGLRQIFAPRSCLNHPKS